MNLSSDVMYQALVRKDSSFEGLFIAAVKTTGIFCRSSCTARKPKPENVEYFESVAEALKNGYRPCKVCKPMEKLGSTPEFITELLKELENDPSLKITAYGIEKRNLEPSKVNRWFQANHGMSFPAYQRMFRINNAYSDLRNGESVTMAAGNNGFESLSGFGDSFRNVTGHSPSETAETGVINMHRFTTELGPMVACATAEGLCLLEFSDRHALETELKDINRLLKYPVIYAQTPFLLEVENQINEYLAGERMDFEVPLVTPGSEFQNKVWKELLKIPYGQTRSYKDQSEALKNPRAIRAIASANGQNRIAIIIPCHRVIGSDGSMTGYAGGIWRKQKLLDLERRNSGQSVQERLF